ncbi:MFS transporter [Streptomyces sp. NPDC050560]|uniref:MFS transporter n=1 Tax=Streptomyces sp. NPDC050560 TaxID=3365630 RepID=UPI0037AE64A4
MRAGRERSDTAGDRDTAAEHAQTRYAWRVLSVTSLGVLLSGTNTSTLDVALPVVARHFSANATQASWIVLSYMLVNTVLILVFGRVADIVGRRRLYFVGLGILTGASVLCGFAPNAVTLAAFRALQAVGAAAIITNTTALLTDAFPARLLSTGLSFNVTAAAAAQVAGPLVGGALASTLGWRAVFWFNVPVGIVGLLWAARTLRPDRGGRRREPFDQVGAVLTFTLIGGLVLALSEGGALGWSSPPVLVGAGLCVVSLPLFLWTQRRRPYPMLDLTMFADRARSMAYASTLLMSVARFAVVLLIALYLQAATGADPFQAGLRVIPVAAGMSLASPLAGRLAARYPTRWVSSAGMAIAAAGLAVLAATLSPTLGYPVIGGCLLAVGVGSAVFLTPNTSSIMGGVEPGRRGIANGVRSMLQNTGYVVSTALSLAIVTSPLAPHEKRAAYAGTLSRLSGAALDAFTTGYRVALTVLAGTCLLGMLLSLTRNAGRRVGVRG